MGPNADRGSAPDQAFIPGPRSLPEARWYVPPLSLVGYCLCCHVRKRWAAGSRQQRRALWSSRIDPRSIAVGQRGCGYYIWVDGWSECEKSRPSKYPCPIRGLKTVARHRWRHVQRRWRWDAVMTALALACDLSIDRPSQLIHQSTQPHHDTPTDTSHGEEEGAADGQVRVGQDLDALLHLCQLHGPRHDAPQPHARRGAPPRALPRQPRPQPLVRACVHVSGVSTGLIGLFDGLVRSSSPILGYASRWYTYRLTPLPSHLHPNHPHSRARRDCGGQDAFYESYFDSQRDLIFRSVEVCVSVWGHGRWINRYTCCTHTDSIGPTPPHPARRRC